MIMSQAVADTHQTGPMSLSNGFDISDGHFKPMDISSVSNGGTTIGSKRLHDDDLPAGQISPRRRSTRASALKAQEKIKFDDDGSMPVEEDEDADEMVNEKIEPSTSEGVSTKRRKIDDGHELDQTHHTFYIQEDNGDVYEVKDGTDISSLNEEELTSLRANYDKLVSRELTDEQKRERLAMVKKCESELRLEEARLLLMKKINTSQSIANQKALEAKKLASTVPSNTCGSAYKPTVALPKASTSSATSTPSKSAAARNPLAALAALTPEQQKELLQKASANPQMLAQLLQLMSSVNKTNGGNAAVSNLAASTQQRQLAKEQQAAKEALLKEQTSHQNAAKAYAALTPQERAANARQAFRLQADKQLTQIPGPKSHTTSLSFIPNPNQPDFCYLVGLDMTVQRILKDKSVLSPVAEIPYECEQCHTDFTPSWRAVGVPGDLHLFCEQCVHANQKRKAQKDHTNLLRKAFNKVNTQEKEFEKQIADGKLDAVMAAAAAQAAQAQAAAQAASSSHSTAASSSGPSTSQVQPQNLSVKQNGSSTPTAPKSSTPVPSTSKFSSSTPSTSSSSKKGSSSSSLNQMQQAQMIMMQQLMRANPMMAMLGGMGSAGTSSSSTNAQAMQMMQQMYNPMMLQMLSQQFQQQSRASQNQTNPATALLMQAVSMSQGSQNANSVQQMAQLAALSQAAFMNNMPAMRQLQERFAEQMKRSNKK